MFQSLTQIMQQYLRGRGAFEASMRAPLLLWEAPTIAGTPPEDAYWERTGSGSGTVKAPAHGTPVIFTVEKAQSKANAFALGVTVGRVATNDIVIDDESVSRFHAFLQNDERKVTWTLSDAESRNGSFVNEVRAEPAQRLPIADGATLRFGSVSLRFLSPPSFLRWLDAQAAKK